MGKARRPLGGPDDPEAFVCLPNVTYSQSWVKITGGGEAVKVEQTFISLWTGSWDWSRADHRAAAERKEDQSKARTQNGRGPRSRKEKKVRFSRQKCSCYQLALIIQMCNTQNY